MAWQRPRPGVEEPGENGRAADPGQRVADVWPGWEQPVPVTMHIAADDSAMAAGGAGFPTAVAGAGTVLAP